LSGVGLAFFTAPTPSRSLAAAAITWAMAELLVARRRLVLPGMLLVCFFAAFIALASPVDFWLATGSWDLPTLQTWFTTPRSSFGGPAMIFDNARSLYAVVGAAAAIVFYARFGLPFALLVVAALLVGAVLAETHRVWPNPGRLTEARVLLGCGGAVFVAAMGFDFSDRERLTRRADCAFWLHLLAAPLIVHSLITLLTPDVYNMTTPLSLQIAAIFAVLAIVAIAIDRRALLVSALIYIGVVIAYGIREAFGAQVDTGPFVLFTTLLALGAVVLIIGVGWQPLRRALMAAFPSVLARRLPPA
jgi:hypothetical protein